MQSPKTSFEREYPQVFDGDLHLSERDIASQQKFLLEQSEEQAAQLRKNLNTYTLHGVPSAQDREYQMAVLEGTSKNVFVGFSEYATHARKDRLAQLLAIRALRDPKASVVFQPQTAWWKDAMNLSPEERDELASGSSGPIVNRTISTLRAHHFLRRKNIHIIGPSLGATFATGLAGQITARSLTVFETADIIEGTGIDLTKDLLSSGPNLYKNIEIGKLDTGTPMLRQGIGSLAMFGINALHPDNLATMRRLRYATHQADLLQALKRNPHMGVVRAWTAQSAISPREENFEITEAIRAYNDGQFAAQVEGYELTDPLASHNSSNIPTLLAMYVGRAMELSSPPAHRLY